jgi:hypothetical protein
VLDGNLKDLSREREGHMSYYIQLTQEERYHISVLCKEGYSLYQPKGNILLIIKLRLTGSLYDVNVIGCNYKGRIIRRDYRIEFVSTPCYYGGQRWWFICHLVVNGSVCNRRVGVLYLGEGEYFGCRYCNNLTYTSSKESGKHDDMYRQWGFDPKEARRALKCRF